VPNISIGFAANCLVAQTLVNDEPTDNVSQPDFMTDDGMRFDGSRAEYRVTDHPGIHVWSADNTGRKTSMQVTDNIVYASQGYEAIVSSNAAALAGNQSRTITYKGNHVKDGKSASDAAYNLLYNDEIKSSKGVFVSEWNDSLPYTLIEPENYDPSKKYPLVVFLHDFWEKGSDNKRHLRQFVWQFLTPENRSKYPCFIVAPQLPMAEPKWKTDGLGSETWPIQCNSLLITELGTKFSIDDKRVYAVGNSMGGAGALNLAIQHPDQIAAVVGISVFYRLTKNSSLQVSKIPIWLIWGEKDERIEPLVKQSIRTDLRGANANFKFTEIAGMGHRCWNDIVAEVPGFMPWLFAQRK
jgi:predicted peptidase